jgi:hypothetical protein
MSTVLEFRPRQQPAYTDSAALNDIHALLSAVGAADPDLTRDIGSWPGPAGR